MTIARTGLILLTLGCGGQQPGGADPERDESRAAPVWINVTNSHGYPVEVYASARGTSYRVGTVMPGANARFELRQGMIGHGPVELTARGRPGERPAKSGELMLSPGDIVDFDIATHLLNSIATIRVLVQPDSTIERLSGSAIESLNL